MEAAGGPQIGEVTRSGGVTRLSLLIIYSQPTYQVEKRFSSTKNSK